MIDKNQITKCKMKLYLCTIVGNSTQNSIIHYASDYLQITMANLSLDSTGNKIPRLLSSPGLSFEMIQTLLACYIHRCATHFQVGLVQKKSLDMD